MEHDSIEQLFDRILWDQHLQKIGEVNDQQHM